MAARRAAFNRAFGVALADWTRSGSDPGAVLRVEDVLARAVANVLDAKVPVLLVVLDGMSWPVAHELLADLRRLHWVEASLPGSTVPPPPVIAAIPSVTEFSRTSLLAGMAIRGKQDDERRLFPVVPALLSRCERNFPPLLFHKGQLTEGSRGAPARPVAQALLNAKNRLVAVVINAVDDRLAGAQQVRDTWTVGGDPPARRPAATGPRVGPGRGPGQRPRPRLAPRPGRHPRPRRRRPLAARRRPRERRRGPAGGAARARRRGTHRLIAPWAEDVRYRAARNGYHGGATPQEMVAPLVVLADATSRQPVPEPCEPRRLAWWEGPDARRPAATAGRTPAPAARPRTPAGYLFPLEPGPAEAEVPVPRPPRRPPSRSRGRPTRPGCAT